MLDRGGFYFTNKIDEIEWFTLDNLPAPLHSGFKYSFNLYRERFRMYESMRTK